MEFEITKTKAYLTLKDYEGALKYLSTIDLSTNEELLCMKAFSLVNLSQTEEALQLLKPSESNIQEHNFISEERLICYLALLADLGKYDSLEENKELLMTQSIHSKLDKTKDLAELYFKQSQLLIYLNKPEEAHYALSQAMKLEEKNLKPSLKYIQNFCMLSFELNKMEAARSCLLKASHIYPEEALISTLLGQLSFREKNHELAKKHWEKAQILKEDYTWVQSLVATVEEGRHP